MAYTLSAYYGRKKRQTKKKKDTKKRKKYVVSVTLYKNLMAKGYRPKTIVAFLDGGTALERRLKELANEIEEDGAQ